MEEHELEEEFLLDREETEPDTAGSGENAHSGVAKAADAPDFIQWEEESLPSLSHLSIANKGIIKKRNVRQGTPQTIVPKVPSLNDQQPMKVTPLLEEDAIVGMKVTCTCGNSHEVRFEFDD